LDALPVDLVLSDPKPPLRTKAGMSDVCHDALPALTVHNYCIEVIGASVEHLKMMRNIGTQLAIQQKQLADENKK
jgi:hypothetical protein